MATKKTASRSKTNKSATKQAATKKSAQSSKKSAFITLNKWNICLGIVFAVQAIVILVLSKSFSLPVVTHYLTTDTLASQAAGHTVLATAVRHLFDINLVYLVAAFLLVSAIFHGIIATKERKRYEASLERGVNGLRWLDYGISAGIMLITIALLNGVYDASSLIMIFVLIALLHLLGFFGETNAVTMKAKRQSFVGLLAAGGTVWLVIAVYLKGAIVLGTGLPHFVYWIDGAIFATTLALAANTLLVFRAKGRWINYLYGERIFMALSFVAKTALAWLIFAGFLK